MARAAAGGPYLQIGRALIPAVGGPATGARYQVTDAPGVGHFYYWLEVVNAGEPPQVFGPAVVRIEAVRCFLPLAAGR